MPLFVRILFQTPSPLMFLLTVALTLGQVAADDSHTLHLHGPTNIVFASREKSAELLKRSDVYTQAMGPFDRRTRMKSTDDVDESAFRKFAASHAREWNADERDRVEAAVTTLAKKLKPLRLTLPKIVYLVKTTGDEEAGAAYCRNPAIILPTSKLKLEEDQLLRLLTHELFHVLSRHNPQLRHELFAIIGFRQCGTIELPREYRSRRITNPDAPLIQHSIELDTEKGKVSAVPVLFASVKKYEEGQGSFFKYLRFQLMEISQVDDAWHPTLVDGEPQFHVPAKTPSYARQIGENTRYIIHPEEVLADNFVALVLNKKDLKTPRIVEEMRAILSRK